MRSRVLQKVFSGLVLAIVFGAPAVWYGFA
jgi:hypothetical protein